MGKTVQFSQKCNEFSGRYLIAIFEKKRPKKKILQNNKNATLPLDVFQYAPTLQYYFLGLIQSQFFSKPFYYLFETEAKMTLFKKKMICKPPPFKKMLIFPSNTPTNTYFQDKKKEKFEIKRVLNDFAVTYHISISP